MFGIFSKKKKDNEVLKFSKQYDMTKENVLMPASEINKILVKEGARSCRKIVFEQGEREGVNLALKGHIKGKKSGPAFYITSPGKIYANPDSKGLFSYFENVRKIEFNNFDTSKATDISRMFNGNKNLKEIDITGFNTSNVTDMSELFYECEKLEKIDVSSFDTSKVKSMKGMFYYCRSLKAIDTGTFDTSSVINMSNTFSCCEKLEYLDVSNWNMSKVKNIESMFMGCERLEHIDIENWDLSSLRRDVTAFLGCSFEPSDEYQDKINEIIGQNLEKDDIELSDKIDPDCVGYSVEEEYLKKAVEEYNENDEEFDDVDFV